MISFRWFRKLYRVIGHHVQKGGCVLVARTYPAHLEFSSNLCTQRSKCMLQSSENNSVDRYMMYLAFHKIPVTNLNHSSREETKITNSSLIVVNRLNL